MKKKKLPKYQFAGSPINPALDITNMGYKNIDGQWYQLVNGQYMPVDVNPEANSGVIAANKKNIPFGQYSTAGVTAGANLDPDGKMRKADVTTDPNHLEYNNFFKGLNTALDLTQGIAGSINDAKQTKADRLKLQKAQQNQSQFNPYETGLNNVPVYSQNGGNPNTQNAYEQYKYADGSYLSNVGENNDDLLNLVYDSSLGDSHKLEGMKQFLRKQKETGIWGNLIKDIKGNEIMGEDYDASFFVRNMRDIIAREQGIKFKQNGGNVVNNTGYLPQYSTANNPINVIPSNVLTMHGVPHDVMAFPDNDNPKLMKQNGGKYVFPNSTHVIEVPMYQAGGNIPKYPDGGKTYKGSQKGFEKDTVYVDKGAGKIYFYDEKGDLQEREALTGKNRSAHLLNPHANLKVSSDNQPDALKVTPIGQFDLSEAQNLYGNPGLTIKGTIDDNKQDIAIHSTYNPSYRNQFYYNGNPKDNAQSYGCVNCNKADSDKIAKLYANKKVYIYDSTLSDEDNQKYNAMNQLISKDHSLYDNLANNFDTSKLVSYRKGKDGKLYSGNEVYDPTTNTIDNNKNLPDIVIRSKKGKANSVPSPTEQHNDPITPQPVQQVQQSQQKYTTPSSNKDKKYVYIVDYLNDQGQDFSFEARKDIAKSVGIKDYKGTAEQNIKLLDIMQKNPNIGTTSEVNKKSGKFGGGFYQDGGGGQDEQKQQLMQMFQEYAQMNNIPVEKLVQQIQQMPDNKKQEVIQQIVQAVQQKGQQAQGQEQQMQNGGVPQVGGVAPQQANGELEKGEVFQNQQGAIQKVAESEPTHDEGGSFQPNVHRVLEDTADKRKDPDSKTLRIKPEEAEQLVGFKPKGNTTHSKLYEMATEFYDKKLQKVQKDIDANLDYIKYNNGGKYAQNSLDENLRLLQELQAKTKGQLFDDIYNHQEQVKQQAGIGQEQQQMKIGGKMKKYVVGGGQGDPIVKQIKDKAKIVTSIPANSRVVGHGDGFTYYGVQGADGQTTYQKMGKPASGQQNQHQDANTYIPTLVNHSWDDLVANKAVSNTPANKAIYDQARAAKYPNTDGSFDYYAMKDPGGATVTQGGEQPTINADGTISDANTQNTKYKLNSPIEASKFNEPLRWYDVAGDFLHYLDATQREPVGLEQLHREPLRTHELNPLPTLLENQGDFNAAKAQLPNNGVGFANQANMQGNKYKANNQVLAQYQAANADRADKTDQYNDQTKYATDSANMQLRDQFNTRVLQSKEIQREQKLKSIDDLFTKIAQNRKLNREGNLALQMTPYFDQFGKFNGNDYDTTLGNFNKQYSGLGISAKEEMINGESKTVVRDAKGNILKVIDKYTPPKTK